MSTKSDSPLLVKIINGCIAGMIGVFSTFPLDLVKTRLQSQRIGPNGEKLYANLPDCFRKIYHAEGWRGFYRGVGISVALATPEKMLKLTANDVFRNRLKSKDGTLSYFRQIIAGAGAGALQMFVSTPLDLVKINMQMAALEDNSKDGTPVKRLTAREMLSGLIREKGIFGLYKGLGPTAIREIVFSSMFFPLYSALIDWGPKNPDGSIPTWCTLTAGLGSGSFTAVFVTPIDVVKTRIQASLKQTDQNGSCTKMLECAATTYANEGITAFFKGGFCRMIVIAPLLGIAQCIYFLGVGERIVEFFSS